MEVRVSHILVDTIEQANELITQINNGAAFSDVAKHSKCPSGLRGGDLGSFGKGMMVPEFEQAAFNSEIGVLVGPVNTQFGWHLILRTA